MSEPVETSALTLNRLSVYLRCLRTLECEGVQRVSSQELADRFHLSPSQIRRDLAQFGGFGVRGVGYDVSSLAERLHRVLRLDALHRLIVVGMGNLGSALSTYLGFNDSSFQVVAGVDSDPGRIGTRIGGVLVDPYDDLAAVARRCEADIGVLTVPADAAPAAYRALVEAGLRAVLNFAPVLLDEVRGVRVKNVDLRVHLEELAVHLGATDADSLRELAAGAQVPARDLEGRADSAEIEPSSALAAAGEAHPHRRG